ncbi:hypothetical protein HY639_01455 [Candidatus Woesearchaeota archaeon]|nr:hypothetical protein [Candidatus Woesearchaeota archaeon]
MKLCFYCDKELIPDKDAQAKNYAECMHCNTGHHLDCFMTHAQCSDCGCGDARFSPAVVAQVSSIDAFVAAYEQKLQDPRFTQAQPGVITELVCAEMHVEPTPQYYGVGEKLNHLEKTHVPRKGAYAVATAAGVGGFAGLGAGHIVGAILSLFGLGIVGYHVVLYSAIGTGTYAGGKTAHFFWKGRQKKYQQERQLLLGGA